MSSIVDNFSDADLVVQDANDNGGFNVMSNLNEDAFIVVNEIDGTESANDPGNDIIITGTGFDFVSGGEGDDIIVGGHGDDILEGNAGSDIIRGGTGIDIIRGGEGADIMMGGSGADIFQLDMGDFANGEIDRIMDFEVGLDVVEINGVDTTKVMIDGNEVKYNGETMIRFSGDMSGMQGDATDEDTFELF
ncbi:MAG: hypothetical protein QNJ60_01165 [Xenococcaceae cyanobacterium MO_188.B19]|nr:hypothetical protein [Xenococcaceae cyanobacterium MO_188.B19]